MSNGSMQFLGRQLNIMANAMGELVEKMALMVQKQDESVPKFSIASNEVKKIALEGNLLNGQKIKLSVFVNGIIRVKFDGESSDGSGTIIFKKNGVTVTSKSISVGTKEYDIDLVVKEDDAIEIVESGSGNISNARICYTLVSKPDIEVSVGA